MVNGVTLLPTRPCSALWLDLACWVRGVSSFPVLKWFVFLLLPLTLGWKLAVRAGDPGGLPDSFVQHSVAEFLLRQRFIVAASEKVEEGQPMIRATVGACRMLVAKSPAMGWDRDLIRRHATPADHIFVVFRGKVYAQQPTWLTVPDYLWSRFQRELGLKARAASVFAIVAVPSCDAEQLPWHELAHT